MTQAWQQVRLWLEAEVVWIPKATERHRDILGSLLGPDGIQANLVPDGIHASLVPDAHLAALSIEHGLLLCSNDGDFARFRDLRWQNPLLQ